MRDRRPQSPAPPPTPSAAGLHLSGPLTTRTVAGPGWAKRQPIYEVNLDAYRFAKGTALREYQKHLPTLGDMGVGIVWFMPLHPRGYKRGFGSAYSVRDYRAINPDLGTLSDFAQLIRLAHRLGLHLLMDWVPNHTAWENPLIETHPEFYAHDAQGQIIQAGPWADVAQLDYGTPEKWNLPLWNAMRDNMVYWLRAGVDGFRCDVAGRAGRVPVAFWRWLRPQLDAVKPVFMLAEADDPYLHPAFDMTYGWSLPPVLWDICAGRKPAGAIDAVLREEARLYPPGAVRMRFLDNHDWHPHADWGWGDRPAVDTSRGLPQVAPLMVLCLTLPGKPLLYNGQEMGLLHTDPSPIAAARLASPLWPFYRPLLRLYQSNTALSEGDFTRLALNNDDKVYAFVRQSGQNKVLVVVNLSDRPQTVTVRGATLAGAYRDCFTSRTSRLASEATWHLTPWAYQVYAGRAG